LVDITKYQNTKMRSVNFEYDDEILKIIIRFGGNKVYSTLYNVKPNDKFKKSILFIIDNKSYEIRFTDSESKDTDIFVRYKDNKLTFDYHRTIIYLTKESVIEEFQLLLSKLP
jgi:hypothetical protein